jgi:hypothetical protein
VGTNVSDIGLYNKLVKQLGSDRTENQL